MVRIKKERRQIFGANASFISTNDSSDAMRMFEIRVEFSSNDAWVKPVFIAGPDVSVELPPGRPRKQIQISTGLSDVAGSCKNKGTKLSVQL